MDGTDNQVDSGIDLLSSEANGHDMNGAQGMSTHIMTHYQSKNLGTGEDEDTIGSEGEGNNKGANASPSISKASIMH